MSAPTLFHFAKLDNYHAGPVNVVSFSNDGSFLATCGHDGYVCVFDMQSIQPVTALRLNNRACGMCAVWAEQGNFLILGLSDGRVLLFGIDVAKPRRPLFLHDWLPFYLAKPAISLSYWGTRKPLLGICCNGFCEVWRKTSSGAWETMIELKQDRVLNMWIVDKSAAVVAFHNRGVCAVDFADPDDLKRGAAFREIDGAAVCRCESVITAVEISRRTVYIYSVLVDKGPLVMIMTQSLPEPVWLKTPNTCVVTCWRSLALIIHASSDGVRVSHLRNGQDVPTASTATSAIPFAGDELLAVCSSFDKFNLASVHVTETLVQINVWVTHKPKNVITRVAGPGGDTCALIDMNELWASRRGMWRKCRAWFAVLVAILAVLAGTVYLHIDKGELGATLKTTWQRFVN